LSFFNQEKIDNLIKKISIHFDNHTSHGFDHTERVYRYALKIGKSEDADMDIVQAAALLHDIGRQKEDNGDVECHAEAGAGMAKAILNEIGFPKEKIEKVINCIKKHRFSKKIQAITKEEKIMQDADRLDAIGAITIARVFAAGALYERPIYDPEIPLKEKDYNEKGTKSSSLHHFFDKILKLKPETFNTKTAQIIAKERYEYVENYVDRFIKEWNGDM
jgi:uncharacterized protein